MTGPNPENPNTQPPAQPGQVIGPVPPLMPRGWTPDDATATTQPNLEAARRQGQQEGADAQAERDARERPGWIIPAVIAGGVVGALLVGAGIDHAVTSGSSNNGENTSSSGIATPTTGAASGTPGLGGTSAGGLCTVDALGPFTDSSFSVNTIGDEGAVVSVWQPQGGPYGTAEVSTTVPGGVIEKFQGEGQVFVYESGCTADDLTAGEVHYDATRPSQTTNWHGHEDLKTLENEGIASRITGNANSTANAGNDQLRQTLALRQQVAKQQPLWQRLADARR